MKDGGFFFFFTKSLPVVSFLQLFHICLVLACFKKNISKVREIFKKGLSVGKVELVLSAFCLFGCL